MVRCVGASTARLEASRLCRHPRCRGPCCSLLTIPTLTALFRGHSHHCRLLGAMSQSPLSYPHAALLQPRSQIPSLSHEDIDPHSILKGQVMEHWLWHCTFHRLPHTDPLSTLYPHTGFPPTKSSEVLRPKLPCRRVRVMVAASSELPLPRSFMSSEFTSSEVMLLVEASMYSRRGSC